MHECGGTGAGTVEKSIVEKDRGSGKRSNYEIGSGG